jgi:hypothetical protein
MSAQCSAQKPEVTSICLLAAWLLDIWPVVVATVLRETPTGTFIPPKLDVDS